MGVQSHQSSDTMKTFVLACLCAVSLAAKLDGLHQLTGNQQEYNFQRTPGSNLVQIRPGNQIAGGEVHGAVVLAGQGSSFIGRSQQQTNEQTVFGPIQTTQYSASQYTSGQRQYNQDQVRGNNQIQSAQATITASQPQYSQSQQLWTNQLNSQNQQATITVSQPQYSQSQQLRTNQINNQNQIQSTITVSQPQYRESQQLRTNQFNSQNQQFRNQNQQFDNQNQQFKTQNQQIIQNQQFDNQNQQYRTVGLSQPKQSSVTFVSQEVSRPVTASVTTVVSQQQPQTFTQNKQYTQTQQIKTQNQQFNNQNQQYRNRNQNQQFKTQNQQFIQNQQFDNQNQQFRNQNQQVIQNQQFDNQNRQFRNQNQQYRTQSQQLSQVSQPKQSSVTFVSQEVSRPVTAGVTTVVSQQQPQTFTQKFSNIETTQQIVSAAQPLQQQYNAQTRIVTQQITPSVYSANKISQNQFTQTQYSQNQNTQIQFNNQNEYNQ